MKELDNSGIAYGIGVLIIFLVSCTAIYIAFTPLLNGLIGQYNTQITASEVSVQRGNSMSWSVTMWNTLPLWMLLGAFVWAVVRALEVREDVG